MKKCLLAVKAAFSLLLLSSGLVVAQPTTPNLVTNGDFEQRNSPPHGPGRLGGETNIGPIVPNLANYSDLPYWFRTTTVNSQPSVPGYIASDGQPGSNTSNFGITAHNSPSCIFIGRHDAPADKTHDDFLTQELNQTLSVGHLYHVEFWALRMGASVFHTKLAISITSGNPTYDGAPNSLIPSPGNKVLVSPDIQQYYTWVKVAGDIFIPSNDTGNNKWLTIGNDRSDQTIDYSLPDNGQNGILFAIDDVSLVDMGCAVPTYPELDIVDVDPCNRLITYQITNYNSSFTYTVTKSSTISYLPDPSDPSIFRFKGGSRSTGGSFSITVTSTCASGSRKLNDSFSFDPCSSLTSADAITTAYPSPVAEVLTLPTGVSQASLLDNQGHAVMRADELGKVDVRTLPEGLYNLRMMQNGKLINQRIQVKH